MTDHAKPTQAQAQAGADDPIVLIVDDDPSMRRALTNLFQSVGLRV